MADCTSSLRRVVNAWMRIIQTRCRAASGLKSNQPRSTAVMKSDPFMHFSQEQGKVAAGLNNLMEFHRGATGSPVTGTQGGADHRPQVGERSLPGVVTRPSPMNPQTPEAAEPVTRIAHSGSGSNRITDSALPSLRLDNGLLVPKALGPLRNRRGPGDLRWMLL